MDASLEDRKKQINELGRTLNIARYSSNHYMSLRTTRAWSFSLLGVASVFVLEWIAEKLGWPHEQAGSFIFGFMPMLLAGVAGFYWGFKTAKYKTYSAKLYAQLAAYEPADPFSYRKLQEAARANTISYDSVSDWWHMENALVMGPPAPSEDDIFKARFVEKSPEDASTQVASSETGQVQAGPRDRPWPTVLKKTAAVEQCNLSTPGYWGLPDDIVFRVTRGDQTSQNPCTFVQMLDFLDASGLNLARDEVQVAGIIAGIPFETDGATMQFEQVRSNGARIDWAMHAHPLKQIIIKIQGTRHSEPEIMLQQVEEVVDRIKRGDVQGESSDDDFGYEFSVDLRSNKPSIFGNAPATSD